MKLFRTRDGVLVERDGVYHKVPAESWDELLCDPALYERVARAADGGSTPPPEPDTVVAPVGQQEVWAAGVTYLRSRAARMEEAREAGGGDFYDRVYHAERPELFFKATGARVVGPNGMVRVRADANWSVPEPELVLFIAPSGRTAGYTVGNDVSSRDIEGENPLYLPQAKVYDGSCALGPCLLLQTEPITTETKIALSISRGAEQVFQGETQLSAMKRRLDELVAYLTRELSFPFGAFLMTGTGVVPPDGFTLLSGDVVEVSIDSIGTLRNTVA